MLVRTYARLTSEERGVAMVEATLGTIILLLVALIVIQLVLVFHGSLAAHGAVARAARTYALTGSYLEAQATYERLTSSSLGALSWDPAVSCHQDGALSICRATVLIPVVVPGAGAMGGGGLIGPITLTESGSYPNVEGG